MADIPVSGLRLWLGSLIHWPARQLQGQLDATERKLEEIKEQFQIELERRARHFEKVAAAWVVTALFVTVAGFFFLVGLWLGSARLFGPVAASFLLAVLFLALAPIPLMVLRKLFPGATPLRRGAVYAVSIQNLELQDRGDIQIATGIAAGLGLDENVRLG